MASGLITKNTDLKSLKYSTIPLGSDSPLVTKDIGQAPENQIGLEISRRIDDTSRIAQMLISKPGIKYLLHEAELQQIGAGDRIQKARKKGKSVVGAVLGEFKNTLVGTTKLVGSTLAQVPVNGTGTHFLKGFRTDTYLKDGGSPSAFAQFFGAGGVEGAPYALRGETVPTNINSDFYDPNVDYTAPSPEVKPIQSLDLSKTTNKYLPQATPAEAADGTILDAFLGTGIDPLNRTYVEQEKQLNTLVETTAKSGSENPQNLIQSVDKVGIEGGGFPSSLDNLPKNIYTDANSYTGHTAQDVANRVAKGGKVSINAGEKYDEQYLRNYDRFLTDHTNTVSVENIQDETGKVVDEYAQGTTVGETSIPKLRSLRTLRAQINTGSVAVVGSDYNNVNTGKLQDFRSGSETTYAFDYNLSTIHKNQRVGLGDQGRAGKNKTNYMITDTTDVDSVNFQDITNDRVDGKKPGHVRDLAKFFFEIITPDQSRFLYFRAFIDSVDDGYNAAWNAHKYVGRAEDFYTYGGFSRDINVSFTVAAATRAEMKPLYKKMVYLASATAPTYGSVGLMRGTLARLTIGSYFAQIPGVITSVKFTLDNNTPWEIAMSNPDGGGGQKTDDDVMELPMLLKCTVSFKPIHDFAPQTGLYHYFTSKEPLSGASPFFNEGDKL